MAFWNKKQPAITDSKPTQAIFDQKSGRFVIPGQGIDFGGQMAELLRGHGNVTYSKVDEEQFIEQGFLKNPTVRAIIGHVQSASNQVNWKVVNKTTGEEYEHPLLTKLMAQPNPLANWSRFIGNSLMFEMLTGNSFILMDNEVTAGGFNEGLPGALINLPSQNVQIELSGDGRRIQSYSLDYFAFQGDIEAEWVIHERESNPDFDLDQRNSFLYGQSRLTSCMRALDTNNEIVDALKGVYENGGPRGILSMEGDDAGLFDQVEIDKVEAALQKDYKGGINQGKFPINNFQWKWIKIGADIKDLDLKNMWEFTSMEICRAYNFPYIILSDGQSSFNNQSEAKKAMWENVILPRLNSLKEALNSRLLPFFGEDLVFELDLSKVAALKEDEEKKAKVLSMSSWMTVNEKREACGLEPMEGMDELDMPMPMMPMMDDEDKEEEVIDKPTKDKKDD